MFPPAESVVTLAGLLVNLEFPIQIFEAIAGLRGAIAAFCPQSTAI
jgi:hypothetical protein